jgi:hypothetical protein
MLTAFPEVKQDSGQLVRIGSIGFRGSESKTDTPAVKRANRIFYC